jgi:hypothetical protein
VRETSPGPEWEVILPDLPLELVAGDLPTTALVRNNYRPGRLTVTKSVTWTGLAPPAPASFTICIQGPSYPTTPDCRAVGFPAFGASPATQQLTWTRLLPGSYVVTEQPPGDAWQVTISGSPAVVPLGGTGLAAVENRYAPATCAIGPSVPGVEYEVGPGGTPEAECAAYGLAPVCKVEMDGSSDTCAGLGLSFFTEQVGEAWFTTVLEVPSNTRLLVLKAGSFLVGHEATTLPNTYPNPGAGATQQELSHLTICKCPSVP